MNTTVAENNQEVACQLSNNLSRLLREFSRDFERRISLALRDRGYPDVRPSHSAVFANLGTGAVRVTELASRAQVTQQAMGKMLKEMERMGYVLRDVDNSDKRAKEIRLTDKGMALAGETLEVIAEVRQHYADKIGIGELGVLEACLRKAVGNLELEYLPNDWAESRRRENTEVGAQVCP